MMVSIYIVCPCGELFKLRSESELGRRQFCSKKCRYELDNFKIPHLFKEPHRNWYKKGDTPWKTGKGKAYWDSNIGYYVIGANGKKYKYHRYIMEQHLQRELLPEEVVHHIDGNKTNNDINNLQLMNSISEHSKHHWNLRKKQNARI